MKQERTSEDEQFVRITAEYVTECEEGRRPQLQAYIQRYPHFADALTDFAAYYHSVEAPLVSTFPDNVYRTDEQGSIQKIIRKASSRVYTTHQDQPMAIVSLLMTAESQPLSIEQLATELRLSQEIVQQLEQHAIEASSIPQAVSRQLALLLRFSVSTIRQYFHIDIHHSTSSSLENGARVAETASVYPISGKYDFLQVVEESSTMTRQQKMLWREIVAQERQIQDTDNRM